MKKIFTSNYGRYLTSILCFGVLNFFLINCKKTETDNPNPTQSPVEIKPGENVGLGANLLAKEAYENIPLLKDPLVGARLAAGKDPILPSTYDLSVSMPPVDNQGQQGSCVAWSVAYAARSYFNKVAQKANYITTDGKRNDDAIFSPAFVYNQVKVNNCNGGSYIGDALNLIQTSGVCSLKDMPYNETDCSTVPTASQKQKAANYKIKKWARVNINSNTFRHFLYFDYPIIFAATLDDNFKRLKEKNSDGEYIWKTYDATTANGGHAMVLVGYDDKKKAFKVQNSWSNRWANNGYIWLDYDNVVAAIREAYVMVAGDNPDLKIPTVETGDITTGSNSASIIKGTITDVGGGAIIRYGFCISATVNQPTEQSEVTGNAITQIPYSFSLSTTQLLANQTYYYRAFVETPDAVYYGAVKSTKITGGSSGPIGLSSDLSLNSGPITGIEKNEISFVADFTNRGDATTYPDYGFIVMPFSYRKGELNSSTLSNATRISLGALKTVGYSRFRGKYSDIIPNTVYKSYAYVKNMQGTTLLSDTTRPQLNQSPPIPIYSNASTITSISPYTSTLSRGTYISQSQTYYFIDNKNQILQWKVGQTQATVLVSLTYPTSIVPDGNGNIYVADNNYIKRVTPSGTVTSIAGNGKGKLLDGKGDQAGFGEIADLSVDTQGNLWIIDVVSVRKMLPDGTVSTYCGDKSAPYKNGSDNLYRDGSLSSARFQWPKALAIDKEGVIYLVDGNRIRKITSTTVSTYAGREIDHSKFPVWFNGSENFSYYTDGQLPNVDLYDPTELTVDADGNLYIIDIWSPGFNANGTTLRRLSSDGKLTTLLGKLFERFPKDGTGDNAVLYDGYGTTLFWVNNSLQMCNGGMIRKVN
ncbi:hypothetical protein GCM10028818_22750 [Spirosoma horti]